MTVGIDIGSTTSHLMFSRLRLQRMSTLSSRFVPVERVVLHRSPVRLTPYRPDGSIDANDLAAFVEAAHATAGIAPGEVDTGAVILTGNALESRNAGAIAETFARRGGAFVCATAGHRLEAILAAHGSGTVARSRREGIVALNVDVGGGTTKLALVERGEVLAASAIRVGARSGPAPSGERDRLARARELARAVVDAACGSSVAEDLRLLAPLPVSPRPAVVTFSGGVGELMWHPTDRDFNDLGPELAAALRALAADLPGPLEPAEEGIRATAVGASQHSVQLSGNTVFVSDEHALPIHNVPVVAVPGPAAGASLSDEVARAIARSGQPGRVLVAMSFEGEPRYPRLRALADALHAGVPAGPIVAAVRGDVARSVGTILVEELGRREVLVLDGLELDDLDYVDIGAVLRPARAVPIVVKTLLF